jgi:ferric-dicitrate binding protein FerR (iron transport regulator)
MNELLTYYTDLISRYFAGEATAGEIQLLSAWISERDEHRILFQEYQKTWELLEYSKIGQMADTDAEWSALGDRMKNIGAAVETKIVPLTPETGTRKPRFAWLKVAASVIVLMAVAAVLYYYFTRPRMVVYTADASSIEKVLPDGSVISLNKGSSIEFPSRFSGNTRNVKLKGEAFFKVTHDKTKPFIVSGGNVRVEVLGTTFNLNTCDIKGNLSVVLASGRISLYFSDRNADKIILLPGEKAEVSAQNHMILKSVNDDPNFLAWKTKRIVFDDMTLAKIVTTLNAVYHSHIILSDAAAGKCRVTATFDHQPVSSVLNVLKGTLDLKVSESGNTITLSGKPCN